MSRLVSKQMRSAPDGITLRSAVTTTERLEDYLERIAKFVPAEILAVYMFLHGIIVRRASPLPAGLEIAVYGLLVVLTAVYLWKLGGTVPRKAIQVVIGTISFVIWTYGIGETFFWLALGRLAGQPLVEPTIAGIVVVLWSLITGLVAPRE